MPGAVETMQPDTQEAGLTYLAAHRALFLHCLESV